MRAIALYDCQGDDPTELTFNAGAIIVEVSEAEDPGWFRGKKDDTNLFGIFPGNYVRFEDDSIQAASCVLEPDKTPTIPSRGPTRVVGVEGLPGPNLLSAKLQPVDAARPMSSVIVTTPDIIPNSKPIISSPSLPFSLTKVGLSESKADIDWARSASAPRKPKIDAMATRKALREKSNTLAAIARENMTAVVSRTNDGSTTSSTNSIITMTPGSVSCIAANFGGLCTNTGAVGPPLRSFSSNVKSNSSSNLSSVSANVTKPGSGGGLAHPLVHSSSSSLRSRSVSAGSNLALPRRPNTSQSNVTAPQSATPPSTTSPRTMTTESDGGSSIIETKPQSVIEAAKAFERAAGNGSINGTAYSSNSKLFGGTGTRLVRNNSLSKVKSSISTSGPAMTKSPSNPALPAVSSSGASLSSFSGHASSASIHMATPILSTSISSSSSLPIAKGQAPVTPPSRPSKPVELRTSSTIRPVTIAKSTIGTSNVPSGKGHAYNNVIDYIPTDARVRYEDVFSRYDANQEGILSGDEVRTIWMRSGLDPPTLGEIWSLADVDEDGALTMEEFCIGMFLIDDRLRGVPVPKQLPDVLLNYARRF